MNRVELDATAAGRHDPLPAVFIQQIASSVC